MKIEFRNDEYMRVYAKAPRGTGEWAFADKRNPDCDEMKFFYGTLSQAKAQAKEYYKQTKQNESWVVIYILP